MKAMRIGECIYCRTKQGPFGDEHLIARGLNGPWVLNEASCKERCEKITSAFEGHVLGPVLRGARAGLKMRMGDRPTTLPLLIDRGDGDFVEVQVPIEDYPAVVQFPEYLPPAYLDTRPYTSGIDLCGERTIQVAGPRPEDVGRRLGAKGMRWTTEFKRTTFPRLIAKVAYTFLVADVGLDSIETSYVVPAILEEADDIGRWVGCDEMHYITDLRYLHGVMQKIVNDEVFMRVRLFACYGAPEYVVVVGRLRPGAVAGKFKVSGPEGISRTRTHAEVEANAQPAPAPFMPKNHTVAVERIPGKRSRSR